MMLETKRLVMPLKRKLKLSLLLGALSAAGFYWGWFGKNLFVLLVALFLFCILCLLFLSILFKRPYLELSQGGFVLASIQKKRIVLWKEVEDIWDSSHGLRNKAFTKIAYRLKSTNGIQKIISSLHRYFFGFDNFISCEFGLNADEMLALMKKYHSNFIYNLRVHQEPEPKDGSCGVSAVCKSTNNRLFEDEVSKIDPSLKCIQGVGGDEFFGSPIGDCFFGMTSQKNDGIYPLEVLPKNPEGVHFYMGAEQQALIDAFVLSDYPKHIKYLHVGNSSSGFNKGNDYSRITASLANAHFPYLEILGLGGWCFSAEGETDEEFAYGFLGSIDRLVDSTPNLKYLYIYGNFILENPLSMPKLENLLISVDDPGAKIHTPPLDATTAANLFRSSFPKLKEYEVYLDAEKNMIRMHYRKNSWRVC